MKISADGGPLLARCRGAAKSRLCSYEYHNVARRYVGCLFAAVGQTTSISSHSVDKRRELVESRSNRIAQQQFVYSGNDACQRRTGAGVQRDGECGSAVERRASLYGEIDDGDDSRKESTAVGRPLSRGPRAPMTVAISADGGKSWSWRRNLDEGDGYLTNNPPLEKLNREFSYPQHQTKPGRYATYRLHPGGVRPSKYDASPPSGLKGAGIMIIGNLNHLSLAGFLPG